MGKSAEYSYNKFLMYQLWQLKDCSSDDDKDVREWVRKEMHLKWRSFFYHLRDSWGKDIVRLMPPEDVFDNIGLLYPYVENMTELVKVIPTKKVVDKWDSLVDKYLLDKDFLFEIVKNCISYDDLKKWIKRGIPVEKLYDLFKSSSFVRPDYGVSNYYGFIKALDGLDKTSVWEDVKEDILKYDGKKHILKDMVENPDKWEALGFKPYDYLGEYFKTKFNDIKLLGPREAICEYVSMDTFMETVDFKWLIDSYRKDNSAWFGVFVGDYDSIKGSTDKLVDRFIEEIGYQSEYAYLLWQLLGYDKGRKLDMERIAKMIAAKTSDKNYPEALVSWGMPKKKVKEIFSNS